MTPSHELIYIGYSRLHRNRANLIQTLHTVAAFQRLGIRVPLYLPSWHGEFALDARLRELGISAPLDVRPVRFLRKGWGLWWFIRRHRGMLSRADAVYVRAPDISLGLAAAGVRHHFEVHTVRSLAESGRLDAIVAHHRRGVIDRLFPISRTAADLLIDAGAVGERVHVSPSGVDLGAYGNLAPFDPGRLDHPRITYLGSISRDRGLGIFETIAARGIAQVTLVGQNADLVEPQPGLSILPHVPHRDVPGLYANTDLVLLPYQSALRHADAISPLKLFEAMAAGRPVIASDLGPIRDILTHEENALLAPPDDVEAWVAAVQRLIADRALAARIAANGRKEAEGYGWERRAAGIAEALGLRQRS